MKSVPKSSLKNIVSAQRRCSIIYSSLQLLLLLRSGAKSVRLQRPLLGRPKNACPHFVLTSQRLPFLPVSHYLRTVRKGFGCWKILKYHSNPTKRHDNFDQGRCARVSPTWRWYGVSRQRSKTPTFSAFFTRAPLPRRPWMNSSSMCRCRCRRHRCCCCTNDGIARQKRLDGRCCCSCSFGSSLQLASFSRRPLPPPSLHIRLRVC